MFKGYNDGVKRREKQSPVFKTGVTTVVTFYHGTIGELRSIWVCIWQCTDDMFPYFSSLRIYMLKVFLGR